ncbi:MAG: hypothetical protein BWY38_03055 [Ignavibacteria bacterium ADurb.Bin266]|nr:MAG: hypothetical protein BWY38_03055 [Ignavibacteria bacterium ADurb.Bin266]
MSDIIHDYGVWGKRRDKIDSKIANMPFEQAFFLLKEEAEKYGIRDALIDFIFEEMNYNPAPIYFDSRITSEQEIINRHRQNQSDRITENGGNLFYFLNQYCSDTDFNFFEFATRYGGKKLYNQIWFLNELVNILNDLSLSEEPRKEPIEFTPGRIKILEKAKEAGRVKYISIDAIVKGDKFDVKKIQDAQCLNYLLNYGYSFNEKPRHNNKQIAEYFTVNKQSIDSVKIRNNHFSEKPEQRVKQFCKEINLTF